jgi:tripartite-type tricarboxylate transporter receptor subunit TctC
LIQDKQLQALAVSSSRRAALMPDVPTTAEAGLAGATYDWWAGVFMPAKTPRDIVSKMHDEVGIALKAPKVQENLAKMGVEPMVMALPQLAKYFAEDIDATVKLARAAKIPIQK